MPLNDAAFKEQRAKQTASKGVDRTQLAQSAQVQPQEPLPWHGSLLG